MKKKNLIVGIAAAAALVSVALLLSKNKKYNWKSMCNAAEDAIDSIRQKVSGSDGQDQSYTSDHGGKQLANKARHRAELQLAANRNGHS